MWNLIHFADTIDLFTELLPCSSLEFSAFGLDDASFDLDTHIPHPASLVHPAHRTWLERFHALTRMYTHNQS